jgi:excinuclease ABC subunit C
MADNNARDFLEHKTAEMDRKKDYTLGALAQLSESLDIKSTLRRIECYDISNISGTDKVASMIVFIDGVKAPKMYRKFKIKTVKGSDDFASLPRHFNQKI